MLEDSNENISRDKTYIAKSYRTRGRSLKTFYEDLDTVMEGDLSYEAFFDIIHCLCELGISIWCPEVGQVKSYGIKTLDGKYRMSSKNMVRTLLTFLGKTISDTNLYTDRQVRRLKAIIRMVAVANREQADEISLKGTIRWLE